MSRWSVIVAVLVVLSGCGNKEKEEPAKTPPAADPAPTPTAAPADAAEPAEPPVTPAVEAGKTGVQFTELESNGTQPVATGLPAIRGDGKVIAVVRTLRSDDAGDNGAALAFLDAASGKVTSELPLIAEDVHEKWTDDSGEVTEAYRTTLVAQTAAANAALAEHTWRPLAVAESEHADDARIATVGELTFEQDGETLGEVVIERAGKKVGSLDPKKALKWPKKPKDPDCAIRGAWMVRAMHDADTSVAAIEFRFAEGHHCGGYEAQIAVTKL